MLHMEQKSYSMEIVNLLLKEDNYIRGLAKKLKINHMTILRRTKELTKANVVDYKKEGKNNVYFLKKTVEARTHAIMAESYKLFMLIKKYPNLRRIIEKIQKNNKVELAILFGSYAKGLAKKDSDIDIYVDTTNKKIKKELEMLDSKLSVKIGKYNKNALLIKEIEKNHIIIKGIEKYYEKNKFFY